MRVRVRGAMKRLKRFQPQAQYVAPQLPTLDDKQLRSGKKVGLQLGQGAMMMSKNHRHWLLISIVVAHISPHHVHTSLLYFLFMKILKSFYLI